MGSAYCDAYAGFSDFEPAKAVDHGDAMDGELIVEVRCDLLNFGQSHGLVGLVFEVESAAVSGMVADESVKDNDGAILIAANISRESDWVYSFMNQRSDVGGGGGHGYTSATAYGWQEGNLIASVKDGIPGRELLIAGSDQRRAILLKFGVPADIAGKKRLDVGLGGKVYGFMGATGNLFQATEEQHLNSDRLGNGRHETIVTCVQRWD
jgi:hypothetical protein